MDRLREDFGRAGIGDYPGGGGDHDPLEDCITPEAPPTAVIPRGERRLQMRAYDHWVALLGESSLPPVGALRLDNQPEFAPWTVLLDFAPQPDGGRNNPRIRYLGAALAEECGVDPSTVRSLADAPRHSLIARIDDHYQDSIASRMPVGFEAEYCNRHGARVIYRGILLPFRADGNDDDGSKCRFVQAVIGWRELADAAITDALIAQIAPALEQMAANDAAGQTQLSETTAARLRELPVMSFAELPRQGEEFTLLVARRRQGKLHLVGEVADTPGLLDRVASKL